MGDFASLAEDLNADSPCGENLEYDPAFQKLETTLRGEGDREYGETRTAAVEPDWRLARELVLALFERTRDLRLACALARIETVQHGLPGLVSALDLLAALVRRQWARVHPQLDPDDGDDPTMRINALAALTDLGGLQRDLSGATFVRSAAGHCTVREAEAVLRGDRPADGAPSVLTRGELQGLIRSAQVAGDPNTAQQALTALRTLVAALGERLGSERGPDLEPFERRLRALSGAFHEAVGGAAAANGDETMATGMTATEAMAAGAPAGPGDAARPDAGAGTSAGGAVAPPAQPAAGAIRNRADVARELERLAAWLERNEPANPASLLIRRAQRVVQMNFLDILNDLAPEGLPEFVKIAGLPPSESN